MKFDKAPLLRVSAALAVVVLFTAVVHEVRKGGGGAPDFPCSQSAASEVEISISKGATGADIAQQLLENGVTKSSAAFFRLAVGDKRSQRIAPGSHRIQIGICSQDALDQLLDPKRITGLINIFEGAWNTEVVAQMVAAGFSKVEVTKAMAAIALPSGFKSLEGLLFPAQYSFAPGTSAQSALSAMVERGNLEIGKSGISASNGKYSAQQLLTIASIVQAEADQKDFSKVSRVIRNRLEKGMPLQMDSTVHYVKKVRGKIFLSTASTLLKSDYNTYRKYGLPPGPIGNPGVAAMRAAVNPELGDWIYFITVAPADTRFTASNDQFNLWKAEYKKNLRAGAFRSNK
jgi:UPF0755 protein